MNDRRSTRYRVTLLIFLIGCTAISILAQNPPTYMLDTGMRELERAKVEKSDDAAYRRAEAAFTAVLERDGGNVQALIHRGEARVALGAIAMGKGSSGTPLFSAGAADMDQAVGLAPDRLDLRLIRGATYAAWPPYMGRAPVAREDLEKATRHEQFGDLPANERARTFHALGVAYINVSEIEKARSAFQSAIHADPDSSLGKDAAERIRTLETAGIMDRYLNLNLSLLGWPHAASCLLAIAAFFPVMFASKGGRSHRRWGRVFSFSYAAACLTSLGIYRSQQFIFAHWLAIAGLAVLAAGYLAVRFKPRGWRYVHLIAMLLSAYNLFGGAVTEAFLRIKPLGALTGGFGSPVFGMTHGVVMMLFILLIVIYVLANALRPARPGKPMEGVKLARS